MHEFRELTGFGGEAGWGWLELRPAGACWGWGWLRLAASGRDLTYPWPRLAGKSGKATTTRTCKPSQQQVPIARQQGYGPLRRESCPICRFQSFASPSVVCLMRFCFFCKNLQILKICPGSSGNSRNACRFQNFSCHLKRQLLLF